MSKFSEVKYYDQLIKIESYIDEIHYQQIFCPECSIAPMHIVRKENINYFASNRKEEHSGDCQYYNKFVKQDRISKLINSDKYLDRKRLEFLIESNLRASIRVLQRKEKLNANNSLSNNRAKNRGQRDTNVNRKHKMESIQRVHVKNVQKTDNLDKYMIIYGESELIVKSKEKEDKETQEKFIEKQLIFKFNDEIAFSVFLSKNQTKYFKQENGNIHFSIFGLLKQNGDYFNFKIRSTKNLLMIKR